MKWVITGADRSTGADATIEVDADTKDQAIKQAGKQLLVEKVRPAKVEPPPPPVEYASPDTPRPAEIPVASVPAERKRAEGSVGASMCTIFAALLHAIGWIAVLSGWMSSASFPDRFKDDNAMGASANALESLLHTSDQYKIRC